MELTRYEKESLITLLSEMNYYEMMAILTKTFGSDEIKMDNARKDILSVYNKLVDDYKNLYI